MDEKRMENRFDDAARNLGRIAGTLQSVPGRIKAQAHEIRLRAGRPVMVSLPDSDVFISQSGGISFQPRPGVLTACKRDMEEAFRILCNSSIYSHQQEIRNGFVVVRGGHRAGICGTAVLEKNEIINLRDISSINLRIARQIPGAADTTLAALENGGKIAGALIFGPPGCGKTTVLRDLARQLSSGTGLHRRARVAIVDERGEIAASFEGIPQNEFGPSCDVLDGYPKGEGILQAVRSLSPDVVICDEIGGEEDARAIAASLNSGVAVIASAHAQSLRELEARPHIHSLIESGAFPKAVLLQGRDSPGVVKQVYNVSGGGDSDASQSDRHDSRLYCLHGGGDDGVDETFQKSPPAGVL